MSHRDAQNLGFTFAWFSIGTLLLLAIGGRK